ncbi:hypothetical protein CASFOL_031325 [Castilleja foliolosa]|uniref:RING-type E3 ubiquitin transferase n=1 Tax=Castilleja foliolosa TaxID=1961234 RepID=A0ABD3C522_9LAMI
MADFHQVRDVDSRVVFTYGNPIPYTSYDDNQNSIGGAQQSVFSQFIDQFYDNQSFDPINDMGSTTASFFDHQFPDQFFDQFDDTGSPTTEPFFDLQFSAQFSDMGSTMSDDDGLSEETIARNLKTSNCPKKEGELCAVCLDDLSRFDKKTIIGSLDCGHEYHEACIKQWLTRKNCCPLCKATGISVCDKIHHLNKRV